MRTLILGILILVSISGFSQINGQFNLVQNGTLDSFSECPCQYDELTFCKGWTSLDSSWRAPDWAHDRSGVPEYVNSCASYYSGCPLTSVPRNDHFYQYPRSGGGMVQLQSFHNYDFTVYDRDYMQTRFIRTLEPFLLIKYLSTLSLSSTICAIAISGHILMMEPLTQQAIHIGHSGSVVPK